MIAPAARTAFRRAAVARVPVTAVSPAQRYYSSSTHENDPEVLELEKRRNLTKNQHKTSTPHPESAPGWNEYLASASEAAVKADRSSGSVGEMQSRTVKHIKDRHHSPDTPPTRPSEGPEATIQEPGTATSKMRDNGEEGTPSHEEVSERDEINGPLRQAKGKTREEVNETAKRRR
ncbi:hypothetical protein CERSUDRAFT_86730 [Gelatoporia subvermispora B]|uniref:Uncharacterized protein n=1 Tax=Ceriporiopsis subvermispora (strain B) TaxID=914234 RepID=M2QP82_CERS8|nr:hypothetical protein CERSUDRAFT_86730 [Gelatoporia subvermispora B]